MRIMDKVLPCHTIPTQEEKGQPSAGPKKTQDLGSMEADYNMDGPKTLRLKDAPTQVYHGLSLVYHDSRS